jgi:hypothetical protein
MRSSIGIALVLGVVSAGAPAFAQFRPYDDRPPPPAPYGAPPYGAPPYGARPYGSPSPYGLPSSEAAETARAIQRQSSGSQAGVLLGAFGGELVLRPFDRRAGVAHLYLPRNAPAISGDEVIDPSQLPRGTRVRVWYRDEPAGRRPSVVGVEILGS